MAFNDWNKDGKRDVQDDFIEYNIYKQSTQQKDNTGCGALGWLAIILVVLSLLSRCGG